MRRTRPETEATIARELQEEVSEYDYHPWFEWGVAGFKVTKKGVHVYTMRMYAPDAFGAVRIELLDANNKVLHSQLFSIFL